MKPEESPLTGSSLEIHDFELSDKFLKTDYNLKRNFETGRTLSWSTLLKAAFSVNVSAVGTTLQENCKKLIFGRNIIENNSIKHYKKGRWNTKKIIIVYKKVRKNSLKTFK